MKLEFDARLAEKYTSPTQRTRVLTESWIHAHAYCPNCGSDELGKYQNNRPVGDFYCSVCCEEFELKSTRNSLGAKVVDGAYQSMIKRIQNNEVPNFFALTYDSLGNRVSNLIAIPSHFFSESVIERRKPLAATARRAGWTGCNILLKLIPVSGRIGIVVNSVPARKVDVLSAWKRMLFLREQAKPEARGWLLDILRCIDSLGKQEFSLADIYRCEAELQRLYPNNRNIKPKIRQQLQVLRDAGYLEFVWRGNYKVV
ncbi:MAG: DpnI domain-containing protein [Ktedonobacteraceae bacterium]